MSHAHARGLPRHLPILPKPDADALAADVAKWFGECLEFLASMNWMFGVDEKGNYLIGEFHAPEPANFERELGGWSLTLRCRAERVRTPRREEELKEARERLHMAITIVLMNLTNSAKAGKLLADLRKMYSLKKLQKAKIM